MTIRPKITAMKLSTEACNTWREDVESGGKVDDVLSRAYWVHKAHFLAVGDIIEARCLDNSWYAHILVIDAVKTSTGVTIPSFALLFHVDLESADKTQATETYHAEFKGAAKFVIIRDSDKAMIERDIPTKDKAEARVAELMAA